MKNQRLFVDQNGQTYLVHNVKELQKTLGGRVSKMYQDKVDGSVVHVGYAIGTYWLREYQPVEKPAS
jgi:hypothetical protein